jgi:hypothetical protein
MNIKKTVVSMFVLSLATLLFPLTSPAKVNVAKGEAPKAAETMAVQSDFPEEFASKKDWDKVGESMKEAYLDAKKAGFPGGKVRCFVLSRDPIRPGDRAFLNSNGFVVQIVAGRTARGTMDLKNLPYVTKLFFVQKISMPKGQ